LHKILFVLPALLIFYSGFGQDLEPRSYAVVPKGLNAMALGLTYSGGNVISDFTSPIQNLDIHTYILSLGYVRTFSLFNKLARVAAIFPYGFLNGTAKAYGIDTSGSRTGFADAKIKFGLNLLGSPVMSPKDFQKFQEHTVLGVSIAFSIPIGQYYPAKLINLGSNRWGFKPEIGFSRRVNRLFYEAYAGIWFFTNNTEFLKNSTLSQKGLLSFQGHVDYTFKHGRYIALNGGFTDGGQTSLDGIERNDEQANWRLGATFSTPIFNVHQSIKLMFNTGIAIKAGQNYTAVTLVYQYAWFKGFFR
jgi:hypothetical protein